MPILQTGPRILHLYRQLKSDEPPLFENDDLSVIGDTPETRITASINTKDAQLNPDHSRYQDGKLAFGYRPFWRFFLGSGFIAAIAGLTFLISAVAHLHLPHFGIALSLITSGAVMMWLGGFTPYRHFIIFDRANGLVHVSTRLRWWKYISLRWQDVSFVNGHWVLPDPYRIKPRPTYNIKLLMPPTTLQRMGVVTYQFQGQALYSAANITRGITNTTVRCSSSDPTWRYIVFFMCHGPEHHPVMQEHINTRKQIRDYFHNGSWEQMLEDDMQDLPIWYRWMSRFRIPDLPDTPTHILGNNGKWRKLKEDERALHRTGPRWEHIKPEHEAILRQS